MWIGASCRPSSAARLATAASLSAISTTCAWPARLLGVLQRLVDASNTVLVVEHNLEVVKAADWVIDLGPEGGAAGGRLIAEGTPEQIAQDPGSYTGQCLREIVWLSENW